MTTMMQGAEEAQETGRLLKPGEVAAIFRVDPKTVTRWAKVGKISSIRTLGGHRRFSEDEVHALLAEMRESRVDPAVTAGADLIVGDPAQDSGAGS